MNAPRRSPCTACPLNRRHFMAQTGLAMAGLTGMFTRPSMAVPVGTETRMRLRVVHALHAAQQPGPDWPNQGFDFQPVMDRMHRDLTSRCPGFDFVTSQATGPDQAKALLTADQAQGGIDGYIVCQMNCWNQVVQTLATSGKPVLYVDFQFGGSGGFLVYNAAFLRQAAGNVGFVASSNPDDLVDAVRCFAFVRQAGTPDAFAAATARVRRQRTAAASAGKPLPDELHCLPAQDCLQRMRETRILVIRDQTQGDEPAIAGIPVRRIPFAELNDAWKAADPEETRVVADRWQASAARIEGVSRQTLEASAAMYLAERALLDRHQAMAITINCLGGFYGGHIHAYPCLGFYQLNNDGRVGGCEGDVRSAATMVVGNLLTQGRPGYISDPVIDTAKHQIIYAHCVAPSKALGPQGPSNPFEILTHSEDRQGASIRSFLPSQFMTTTLEFDQGRKEILFHQAVAVGNDTDDRACRTKLCAEPVGDLEKLFTQWDHWGWHRVTFYGDLKDPVFTLADALGWKIREEA